nr:hypothetical protein [Tanacetum cinerariifolium]
MADENVLALAPTRFDDQILPFATWVPIGKSNFVLDLQKKQKNPIFQISAKTGAYHQFVSPPSSDAIMDLVNELGYTEAQIPSSPDVLGPTKKGRKDKPHVILYFRFTKLIICHLGRIHNIHPRSTSPFCLDEEDLILGNLKFVTKGEKDEVFEMPIPNELISNNIRNASYYNAYMEMVAKHIRRITAEKEGKKKHITAKQPKPKPAIEKSRKPALVPKPKVIKEKPAKPSPAKRSNMGKVLKLAKERVLSNSSMKKNHLNLNLNRNPNIKYQRPLDHYQWLKAKRRTPATKEGSTGPYAQPQDDASANIFHESLSPANAETGVDSDKTTSGEKIVELDEGQAGSDPVKTPESRPPPEQEFIEED